MNDRARMMMMTIPGIQASVCQILPACLPACLALVMARQASHLMFESTSPF